MKPIILQADRDGFVKVKTSELKKIFDDIYNEGYRDGHNSHWWTYTTPSWTYTATDLAGTGSKKWWDDMQITCDANQFATTISSAENNCITIKGGNENVIKN